MQKQAYPELVGAPIGEIMKIGIIGGNLVTRPTSPRTSYAVLVDRL
jgi:hypothetical protein